MPVGPGGLAGSSAAAGQSDWVARVGEARQAARQRMRSTLGPYERDPGRLAGRLAALGHCRARRHYPGQYLGGRLLETYVPRTTLHSATYAIGLGLSTAIGASVGRPTCRLY